MSEIFLTVLNMSFTAGYVILIVILARLLLKKAPKFISYLLWSIVAFRLVIPFSFESMFSLLPRNTNPAPISHEIIYQSPRINNGIEAANSFVNQSAVGASVNPVQIHVEIGAYVWLLGIIALLIYSLVSVLLINRQLKGALPVEKNIFEANNLKTPFVFGIIRPKIYLPVGLNSEERSYILLHEQTHIQRKDHIIKIFAFLILSIHWFNPLVWLAFRLMNMDMELSCDERVLKEMSEDIKKPYANSLLSLAVGKHILNGSPLAFGEGDVKGRIKNVLNYKKPRFWVILLSLIIVIAIGVGLATNPKSAASFNGSSYHVQEILYQAPIYSFIYTLENTPQYCISSDYVLFSKQPSADNWVMHGGLNPYKISRQELYALFIPPVGNIQEIINNTKLIYRADAGDDKKTFYLVMQLENGDVFLATGYDKESPRHIRWLFKLEKQGDDQIAGSASESINKKELTKTKDENEIAKLVEENLTHNNVTDETLTPQEWYNALSIRQEVKLPDFEYDGNDSIEKLVYATEIEKNSQTQEGFTIVAPKIFGSYEEGGLLKVFVTTFSATYKLYGNVLDMVSGSVVPSAITYKKDNSGNYILEKYEQSKDGADWLPSIKKFCTMPVSGKVIPGLADKIIDHYGNRDDIHVLMWENLFKHLKANGIKEATLINSRGEIEFSMSNPQYIK